MADLVACLVEVALDSSEVLALRADAASALVAIGDKEATSRLLPLATEALPEDVADELKGHALVAVWPDHLTTPALFAALSPPKKEMLFGSYGHFLRDRVVPRLTSEGLAFGLEWVSRLGEDDPDSHLRELADAIVEAGWAQFEGDDLVAEAFVAALTDALVSFKPLIRRFRSDAFQQDDARHGLIERLVPKLQGWAREDGRLGGLLIASTPPLLFPSDLEWLLTRLRDSVDTDEEIVWAQLAHAAIWPLDEARIDLMFAGREVSSEFSRLTDPLVKPIDIHSEVADQERAFLGGRDQRRLDEEALATEEELKGRVGQDLAALEGGELERWISLNGVLGADPRTRRFNPFEGDLTAFSGWKSASPETRARVLRGAESFATSFEIDASDGFGTKSYSRAILAGHRALLLLMRLSPQVAFSLDDRILARWSPAVVGFPNVGDDDAYGALLSLVWARAPEETLHWLVEAVRIEAKGEQSQHLWTLHRFREISDERLEAALVALAQERLWPPGPFGELLDALLSRHSEGGRKIAEDALRGPLDDAALRDRAIVAAGKLIEYAPDCAWSIVWPLIQRDPELGGVVLEAAADRRTGRLSEALSETDLGDLFFWLEKQYPADENPPGTGFVPGHEDIQFLRNALLNALVARGNAAAVRALRRLCKRLPQLEYLARVVTAAENRLRQTSWTPPSAADVVRLAQEAQSRFVTSAAQLSEVVVESLARAQARLQGETRAVADVWNTDPTNPQPKTENELSDWLKRFLDDDLQGRRVVVNREVEVRPGPSGHLGDRTDLHVVAIAPDNSQCTVVVEVKGCWHRNLRTAMRDQLLDQYLKPLRLDAGIYVVGWFAGEHWDPTNARRRACARCDLETAADLFRVQAEDLSMASDLSIRSVVLDLHY